MEATLLDLEVHAGGCLCGAVRYATTGQPRYQANCHCSFCKKVTGSAYLVETVFLSENIALSGTSYKTYEMCSPSHGRTMRVHFCSECGTSVALSFARFPAVQAICSGTYDDPNWFEVRRHIFTNTAMHDIAFPADMEVFEGHSVKLDGTMETPLAKPSHPCSIRELRAEAR